MRIVIAFLVAPLLPAILPAWRIGLPAYVYVCCLAYLYQTVVGIPAFLFFSHKTHHQLWPYLLLGFLAGAVSLAAVAITRDDLSRLYFSIGLMGILGACTALIFWLVARPDKKSITTKAQISN